MSSLLGELEKGIFVGTALATAAYGVHLALFSQSLKYLTRKPTSQSIPLILYSLALFGLATAGFALEIHANIFTFVDHCSTAASYLEGSGATDLTLATTTIFVMLNWLAEAILLYRVCSLYSMIRMYWFARIFSTAALLALIVTGSVYMHEISMLGTQFAKALHSTRCMAYIILSLVLNICTTSAVLIPVAAHYIKYWSVLSSSKVHPAALPLRVLVEAASLYAMLAFAVTVVIAVRSPIQSVFLPMLGHLQAVPPMVAVLKLLKREHEAATRCLPRRELNNSTDSLKFASSVCPSDWTEFADDDYDPPKDLEDSIRVSAASDDRFPTKIHPVTCSRGQISLPPYSTRNSYNGDVFNTLHRDIYSSITRPQATAGSSGSHVPSRNRCTSSLDPVIVYTLRTPAA